MSGMNRPNFDALWGGSEDSESAYRRGWDDGFENGYQEAQQDLDEDGPTQEIVLLRCGGSGLPTVEVDVDDMPTLETYR